MSQKIMSTTTNKSDSTCILCYNSFVVPKPNCNLPPGSDKGFYKKNVANQWFSNCEEEKENFQIFCKSLKISENNEVFQHFDFKSNFPFCGGCSHFSKELNEHYQSRNRIQKEVLTLQTLVIERLRDLSECVEKFDDTFQQIKNLVEISEKTKARRAKGGKKGVEGVVSNDENLKVLRQLILEEWSPEKLKNQQSQYEEETRRKVHETRGLFDASPPGFIVPESSRCDKKIKAEQFYIDAEEDDGDAYYEQSGLIKDLLDESEPESSNLEEHSNRSKNSCLDFPKQKKKADSEGPWGFKHMGHNNAHVSAADTYETEEPNEIPVPAPKKLKRDHLSTEPITRDEENCALSEKHSLILGHFEFEDDKIVYEDVEVKRTQNGHLCSYTCDDCGLTRVANLTKISSIQDTGQFLRVHLLAKHMGGFTCNVCVDKKPFSTTSEEAVLKHIRKKHKDAKLKCQNSFIEKPLIQPEQCENKNDEEIVMTETVVPIKLSQRRSKKNRKTESSAKNICLECEKTFRNIQDFKLHMQGHFEETETQSNRIPCQYCGEMCFPGSIQSHLELFHSKSIVKWHSCQFCELKFYNETVLSRHIRRSHPASEETEHGSSFSTCDESFECEEKLQSHKASHVEEIDNTEISNVELKVEEGSRTKKCKMKLIQKKKKEKSVRNKQPKQQSKTCTICNSTFATNYRLQRHLQTVHADLAGPQTVYDCTLCDSSFILRYKLLRHLRTVHKKMCIKKIKV